MTTAIKDQLDAIMERSGHIETEDGLLVYLKQDENAAWLEFFEKRDGLDPGFVGRVGRTSVDDLLADADAYVAEVRNAIAERTGATPVEAAGIRDSLVAATRHAARLETDDGLLIHLKQSSGTTATWLEVFEKREGADPEFSGRFSKQTLAEALDAADGFVAGVRADIAAHDAAKAADQEPAVPGL